MSRNATSSALTILIGAATLGTTAGALSMTASAEGRDRIATAAKRVGIASGVMRRRPPRSGDQWGGCNDARAAGTAPIYRGEPGYRADMDGDGDGIACEPYRG